MNQKKLINNLSKSLFVFLRRNRYDASSKYACTGRYRTDRRGHIYYHTYGAIYCIAIYCRILQYITYCTRKFLQYVVAKWLIYCNIYCSNFAIYCKIWYIAKLYCSHIIYCKNVTIFLQYVANHIVNFIKKLHRCKKY